MNMIQENPVEELMCKKTAFPPGLNMLNAWLGSRDDWSIVIIVTIF